MGLNKKEGRKKSGERRKRWTMLRDDWTETKITNNCVSVFNIFTHAHSAGGENGGFDTGVTQNSPHMT